ncbi:hypothetical protein EDB84DRAFT_424473 [Lactarius hengduanensis]|nr:hypothetical protein EDB84DRAFT_424473 [Lactarius hengduanensis]
MIDDHNYEKAEDEKSGGGSSAIPGRSCCIACYNLASVCASSPSPSSSMAPKVGGAGLVLLYVVQCAIWSWVHRIRRIPAESRTGAHGALLALGGVIILLAFFETWLGLISGRPVHTRVVGAVIYCPFPCTLLVC